MNALVKNQRRSFVVFIFLCIQLYAAAQPSAGFTASVQSGCSPLIVHFTDQSTGNPDQWKWELGNGAVSTLQHPSATYFNPGTYTVKLVVKNAQGVDSVAQTNYITVYSNPAVAFGASDTTGCFSLGVQFTDSSMAGSGNIISWQWDFGDGSISSLQHPFHTYASPGNYSVTLKVTNSFGCIKSVTKSQYIAVSNGVEAAFAYTAPSLCSAPVNIQFTNSTTGPGNLQYQWNAGNGNSSSQANPSFYFNANGNYPVTLIATSSAGCSDTTTMNVSIGSQLADFQAPSTACTNQNINFNNISSPLPVSVTWSFGDGTGSTAIHPVKKYTLPGTYTVKMVADFGGCVDSVSKQITVVAKPLAQASADKINFCQMPAVVQFTGSGNGYNHFWIFGDGQTSTLPNPVHTYSAEGIYTVKLIVTNAAGCSDTILKNNYIRVKEPVIQFQNLPQQGCNPLTVSPTAQVISVEPVQSWLWHFGDGGTSNQQYPTHTYTAAGNYNIFLEITTVSGCKDTLTMVNAVRVGNKPKANFVVPNDEVCNLYNVGFIDSSTGNVDQWYWDFGDNYNSNVQNPSHVFGGLGYFDVTLVVWSNGCADTITKENVVHILPPISGFQVQHSCENKMTKSFTNMSVGATSWLWNFGDGNTSTQQHPSHTYAAPGEYTVSLSVSNGTCSNYNYLIVKVIDEEITLTNWDVTCKGDTSYFLSPNTNHDNIASWAWDFGDGSISTAAAPQYHIYQNTGYFIIKGSIIDLHGCKDSASVGIYVNGPTANFHISDDVVCLDGNNIHFEDSSYNDGSHQIVEWNWNFGDGTQATLSGNQSVNHQYGTAGQYTVALTVKDITGCKDTKTFSPVIVSKPVADFYSPDSLSCTAKDIRFFNNSTGSQVQYEWNLGDGNISSLAQPVHQYAAIGTYNVSLLVTDQYGCRDSLVKPSYINISFPTAQFQLSDSFGTCPPLMVHFNNQSANYTELLWSFGDGSSSVLPNPSHYFTTAGTFYPKLVVKGPGGCMDSMSKKVIVKGPSGSFGYDPLEGCNPLTVNFTMNAQNAISVVWDFSDGNTLASTGNSASHSYTVAGDFLPKLILVDTAGCSVPIVGQDTIRVFEVTAGFEIDKDSICGAGEVFFSNSSQSNDMISHYQWIFGDGSISNLASPSHLYTQNGMYAVQLITTTVHGCKDTVSMNDLIRVLEKPEIIINGITEACMPATIDLTAQVNKGDAGTFSWLWDFGNGVTSSQAQPVSQQYPLDGTYYVTAEVLALNGCRDTAQHQLIIHPLPGTEAGDDLSICRGATVQLYANGANQYVWSGSGLNCTNCPDPVASPLQTTMLYVVGTNTFGCSRMDSLELTVHQPFELKASNNDSICLGEKAQLSATGGAHYAWYPATGLSHPNSASTSASPSQTTTYQVIATDANLCFSDTGYVHIKVWPIPSVTAGIDKELVVGDLLQLNATGSSDIITWQWTPAASLSCASCKSTLAMPKQSTTYKVQVRNEGGCVAEDEVRITVICNNGNLMIPNTFSPNGDGMNDRFYPSGKGINMIRNMRIYNRWGQVVYERNGFNANDPSAGWDGKFKGQVLPPDVYVYTCEVVCMNNEVLTYKGDVTLLQ